MKKILCSVVLFIVAITFSFSSLAATGVTTLELVDNSVCNIEIEDIAKFKKELTQFNANDRSATLTLTMINNAQPTVLEKDVEVFLVIDNSTSMVENRVGNSTRKQVVIDSANTLADKLFEANPNVKVGVVSFSSLDTTKGETEGTINDAQLLLTLNNSKSEVKNAISSIEASEEGPRTNIEAGVTIAEQNYSEEENTNRYIVLLTDGVPNNDTNGNFATYIGEVGARTKSKLQDIEANGIKIIGAMIGLDGERVEGQSNKTYRALAEEVFGTVENPTISSYYYIQDDEIETTIVDKIFSDIVTVINHSMSDIVIKDYFPQEIIDNFNFEYVASPNIGEVSAEVDTTDNSITWNIELLKEGEVATLSYKLTLKDDYNKEIINKVLPTNTKVDITGKYDGEDVSNTSDVSPKVKVLYEEIKDNTVAEKPIPQTGENSSIGFAIIVSAISIIAIARVIYLRKNKDM